MGDVSHLPCQCLNLVRQGGEGNLNRGIRGIRERTGAETRIARKLNCRESGRTRNWLWISRVLFLLKASLLGGELPQPCEWSQSGPGDVWKNVRSARASALPFFVAQWSCRVSIAIDFESRKGRLNEGPARQSFQPSIETHLSFARTPAFKRRAGYCRYVPLGYNKEG